MARPDATSLVAGLVFVLLGVVLLLDRLETLDLRFSAVGPLLFAAGGAILLASGLSRPR